MSNIKVNTINDASGGNAAKLYGVSMRDGGTGWVNRIINGDMRIDQRNAGASVTPANTAYTLDRWQYWGQAASKFSIQQSSVAPAGFSSSLKATVISPVTVTTADYYIISQAIEGFNTADLSFGSSSARTVTLSFWVQCSLTGTFGGSIANGATNRSYPFTYTINSANTWEYKTVTVAGDQSGTWVGATNGNGMYVNFGLGMGTTYSGSAGAWASADYRSAAGATSVVGTNGATFYITGVQLEAGTVASPFERRDYGRELMMCQRYCLVDTNESQAYRWFANGYAVSSTSGAFGRQLPVIMRTPPSVTVSLTTGFLVDSAAGATTTNVTDSGYASTSVARLSATVASGLTAGWGATLASDGTTNRRTITYSAEL